MGTLQTIDGLFSQQQRNLCPAQKKVHLEKELSFSIAFPWSKNNTAIILQARGSSII
jgi:hypothetical protein